MKLAVMFLLAVKLPAEWSKVKNPSPTQAFVSQPWLHIEIPEEI